MTWQLSVGLLTGMAAAMIVPAARRSVPRWMEVLIWIGLIVACWMAVTNLQQPSVRHLTESTAWGLGQVVSTSIGLLFAGLVGWVADHRFAIADAVVMLWGADLLVLAMLRSRRHAYEWMPRILLGEWIELPLQQRSATAPVVVPYAMDEWNRRAEHAVAILAAAFLTWLVQLLIWTRDVVISQTVASGRVRAAAGLESLRERAIQMQVAARAWRAQHAPAVAGLAGSVGHVLNRAASGETGSGLTEDQVINIRPRLRAQSIGRYGPVVPAPASIGAEERQEDESDQLAS